MGRNNDFSRSKPKYPTGRKVLIACEGEKTEYGYFEAIRKFMRLQTLQVHVIKPGGSDPLTVVRSVILEHRFRVRGGAWTKDDQAWAVFDGDEHIVNNPENWNDAQQIAASNGVNLAISNPSFEFWYLLHFQDQWANLSRSQASALLKTHISAYQKSDVIFPEPLGERTENATQRARRLDEIIRDNGLRSFSNPSTSVWRLVMSLHALQEELRKN